MARTVPMSLLNASPMPFSTAFGNLAPADILSVRVEDLLSISEHVSQFDPYQFGKYNNTSKDKTFKKVINVTRLH
jgi:hypothetical protein